MSELSFFLGAVQCSFDFYLMTVNLEERTVLECLGI